VLLDEFGNLPQIRDFDKTVTVARGRGIRVLLAVQDLAQLKRHYAEAAHTIKGNLRLWLYLLTSDIDTAREVSQKLGQYTVAAQNVSVPRVTWWTTTATVGTSSTTHSLHGRDLLTAEEVLRWPPGQVLLIQAGQLPARLPLPDLSAWRAVWPAIQTRQEAPSSSPVSAPPTWRPPDPDLEGGEIEGPVADPVQSEGPADQQAGNFSW
jgi:type IV secretion system protein VirD4